MKDCSRTFLTLCPSLAKEVQTGRYGSCYPPCNSLRIAEFPVSDYVLLRLSELSGLIDVLSRKMDMEVN